MSEGEQVLLELGGDALALALCVGDAENDSLLVMEGEGVALAMLDHARMAAVRATLPALGHRRL